VVLLALLVTTFNKVAFLLVLLPTEYRVVLMMEPSMIFGTLLKCGVENR
jgi:hypothetical protein